MQYREDKKTGNKLSILGFGCMRFPSTLGHIDIQKTQQLILSAIEKGVNYFDTAYLYSGSEVALGQILEKHDKRKEVYLATKLPLMLCKKTSDFDKYFHIQLERLKTDYIDYYFMHMLTGPNQWKELCDLGIQEWIEEKQKKGQIRQIGFSFHGKRDDFKELIDSYPWDFCQIQYNYININYQAGVTGLTYAASKNISVFIMEPLLGGRLATGLPGKAVSLFQKVNPQWTPVTWAFKWLWNQPEVTLLLSGMNEMEQLEENICIAQTAKPDMLKSEEIQTVSEVIDVFNDSYKVPCTGCGYCMPCPKGVNIPSCFACYNSSYAINRMTGFKQYIMSTGVTSTETSNAGKCVECGQCEKHCPQNIPIRESLKAVQKRMEPLWYRIWIFLFRKFIGH